jgi:hypothetical protein
MAGLTTERGRLLVVSHSLASHLRVFEEVAPTATPEPAHSVLEPV